MSRPPVGMRSARIGRRTLITGLALSAGVAACSRRGDPRAPLEPSPAEPSVPPPTQLVSWTFAEQGVRGHVALMVPVAASGAPDAGASGASARYPVLIALHGRGEAVKTPAEGALGWPRDYSLVQAVERIAAPPLTLQDFQGLVEPNYLDTLNHALADTPFRGLVIACPYVPDLDLANIRDVLEYGAFLRDGLLPRVRRDLPALASPASTGIDGVSLGGAVALRVGLSMPDTFGAVGALQPAMSSDEAPGFAELARAAFARAPSLRLRITTSHGDYFREAVRRLDASLRQYGVSHDFAELPGPHDYVFNRGPGAFEMLFWHDRTLAHA